MIGEFVAVPPCHDCVIAAFAEFLFLEAFLLARTAASSLNDIRDISCCNRALSKGSEKGGGSIRGMNLVLKIEEEETSFLFSDQVQNLINRICSSPFLVIQHMEVVSRVSFTRKMTMVLKFC